MDDLETISSKFRVRLITFSAYPRFHLYNNPAPLFPYEGVAYHLQIPGSEFACR